MMMNFYQYKGFWVNLIGEEWTNILGEDLLFSKNTCSILEQLDLLYFIKNIKLFPNKNKIFNFLKFCPPKELKCIIVGDTPYTTLDNNGLAFGVDAYILKENYPKDIQIWKNSLKNHYNCDKHYFDITFRSWAKQGILMVNKSITISNNIIYNHEKLWHKFIYNLLRILIKKYNLIVIIVTTIDTKFLNYIKTNAFVIKRFSLKYYYNNMDSFNINYTNINTILVNQKKNPILWVDLF